MLIDSLLEFFEVFGSLSHILACLRTVRAEGFAGLPQRLICRLRFVLAFFKRLRMLSLENRKGIFAIQPLVEPRRG
jgi:hypothetical protein